MSEMTLPPSFTATVTRRDNTAVYHEHCRMADVDRLAVLVLYGDGDPLIAHYETTELRSVELRWPEEGA